MGSSAADNACNCTGGPLPLNYVLASTWPDLVAYFRRRGMSEDDAEDAAVDVGLKASEAYPRFRPDGAHSTRAWLFAIAHNTMVDFWRQSKRTAMHPVDNRHASTSLRWTEDTVTARDGIRWVIERLSQKLRPEELTILPYLLRGMRPQDIAAETGIAPEEVSRLKYRIKKVAEELFGGPDGMQAALAGL